MKKMLVLLLATSFILLFFSGCKNSSESSYPGDYKGGSHYEEYDENVNKAQQAGQLTASEWSDLKNYDFYLSLFESSQESAEGVFKPFIEKGYFDTLNRIEVNVANGDTYLCGSIVELINSDQEVIYNAISNANGKAYLFPSSGELDSIRGINIKHGDQTISHPYQYSKENNTLTIQLNGVGNHLDVIELMFVVDTTGSMGDEIDYLKAEINYVINEVKKSSPNTTIKLALLFYRDIGDEYVTKFYNFSTDIDEQKRNLSEQSAGGGGDFEEAVEIALDEAVLKNWSGDNTTKLLFHVLDAPPHFKQANMSKYSNAIKIASQKGIRIIPIASSGIDKYTEYLLRNEAMMTGGTYVFITNDSGIGGDHLDASVGETDVEYLNHLMIRLIKEFHTGVEGEKIPYISGD